VGLGNALWQLGERERSIEVYKDAIRSSPHYAPGYYGLAYYYAELHRPEDALGILNELAKMQPNDARVYGEIALIQVQRKRYEEALGAFNRAVHLNANILRDIPRFHAALQQAEAHSKSPTGSDDTPRR
jgi:tetratricopeptide (TPR) repeat protein